MFRFSAIFFVHVQQNSDTNLLLARRMAIATSITGIATITMQIWSFFYTHYGNDFCVARVYLCNILFLAGHHVLLLSFIYFYAKYF
jgi:hypothetical protein